MKNSLSCLDFLLNLPTMVVTLQVSFDHAITTTSNEPLQW